MSDEAVMGEGDGAAHKIKVRRGRVDSLSLYEITDHELDILEKGSPNSVYLNFGILSLTIGLSFLSSLLSVEIESNRVFFVFVILTTVGTLFGIILLVIWYRMRSAVSDVVQKIKNRIVE